LGEQTTLENKLSTRQTLSLQTYRCSEGVGWSVGREASKKEHLVGADINKLMKACALNQLW